MSANRDAELQSGLLREGQQPQIVQGAHHVQFANPLSFLHSPPPASPLLVPRVPAPGKVAKTASSMVAQSTLSREQVRQEMLAFRVNPVSTEGNHYVGGEAGYLPEQHGFMCVDGP